MKIKSLLCALAFVLCLTETAIGAIGNDSLTASIYNYARNHRRLALEHLKQRGYSIDATDSKGNTALCRAIMYKDQKAYTLLRQMGANPAHPCVKRLGINRQPSGFKLPSWNIKPAAYVGAAVLAGGAVALAAGGGGGGGGDSSADAGGTESGGAESGGNTGYLINPGYFETSEYTNGNFLKQINAADMYARYYSTTDSGQLTSTLETVAVGMVDDGVYGAHSAFSGKQIKGINYDYGPCQNGDTSNCWRWDDTTASAKLTLSDGNVHYSKQDEADFIAWAAAYDEGYDWDAVKDSATNYYPNSSLKDTHGTHVAGIIAADKDNSGMHGVAFDNAELLVARYDLMSPVENPARDLIDMGAKVINFSLGIDATALVNASLAPYLESSFSDYRDIIRYQIEKNVVFVLSAGNESYTQPGILNGIPLLSEFKESLDGLFVTVVAVDENNQIATFSNHCGAAQNYCLAAPGVNIVSTINRGDSYASMSGTSMAAPVVTGSIAVLMGAYPYMTPQEVVKLLFETATDLGSPGTDSVYGNGLVNLDAASEPQGNLTIAAADNINDEFVSARSTIVNVPAVFKSAMLAKMPNQVTVFDKYKRPYAMPMTAMVQTTHSGERNFKNDMSAFSRRQKKRTVKTGSNLTFSYAPAVLKSAPNGLGTIDMSFSGANGNVTGFYYTENTLYNADSYFEKALSNPFTAMNSAYGIYNSSSLTDNLKMTMGFATGENGLYDGSREANDFDFDKRVYGLNSEISWQMADNLSLAAIGGMLYEDGALLGLNGTGGFDIGDSGTYYAGIALTWSPIKNVFLGGTYYQGWTESASASSNLLQTSRLISDSFALDAHWQYNKTDIVGFQLSSPLRIHKGKARFNLPTGRDNYSDAVYRKQYELSLKPDAREYKFSLYHERELEKDMDFKMQADMRLNPDHEKNAQTDYRVMFGFNWTFN